MKSKDMRVGMEVAIGASNSKYDDDLLRLLTQQ
jgi:hypothetical protein